MTKICNHSILITREKGHKEKGNKMEVWVVVDYPDSSCGGSIIGAYTNLYQVSKAIRDSLLWMDGSFRGIINGFSFNPIEKSFEISYFEGDDYHPYFETECYSYFEIQKVKINE